MQCSHLLFAIIPLARNQPTEKREPSSHLSHNCRFQALAQHWPLLSACTWFRDGSARSVPRGLARSRAPWTKLRRGVLLASGPESRLIDLRSSRPMVPETNSYLPGQTIAIGHASPSLHEGRDHHKGRSAQLAASPVFIFVGLPATNGSGLSRSRSCLTSFV